MRSRFALLPFFSSFALCVTATTSAAQGPCGDEVALHYLSAGPLAPALRTPRGAPVLGGDFAFRVERGAPLALGALAYSAFDAPVFDPLFGATIWPQAPLFFVLFGTDGDGDSPLVLDTPEVFDDLCGASATFQAFVFDALAPSGVAVTNAVRLRVGSVTEPLFDSALEVPTDDPIAIAVGDTNGDLLPDLVTLVSSPPRVEVRLASAPGTFGAPTSTLLTGLAPASLALAHLDADADLDAVVANEDSDDVSVLFGDGAGGFGGEQRFGAANGPIHVDVGLVNGDGFADLVVANSQDSRVSILLGNGTGFAPAMHFDAGFGPGGSGVFDARLADVDHDSDLDVVAVAYFGNLVSVMLGDGGGALAAPTFHPASRPRHLALGDFDGDTNVDVAALLAVDGQIALRRGFGDGTFGEEVLLEVGRIPIALSTIDMGGDLLDDLVAANSFSMDVSVFRYDGASFTRREFALANTPSSLCVADVDLDGVQDVLVGNLENQPFDIEPGVTITKGEWSGRLASAEDFRAGALHPSFGFLDDVAAADLDGDGHTDLVASSRSAGGFDSGLYVLRGEGEGRFTPPSSVGGPWTNVQIVGIHPIDGDEVPDLVVIDFNGTAFEVHLGNGDGTFALDPIVSPIGVHSSFAIFEDVDLDQLVDVITLNFNSVRVMLGNGDGSFDAPVLSPSDFDYLVAGRFDADTDVDLIGVTSIGDLVFADLASNGSIVSMTPITVLPNASGLHGAQDLNGDGVLDLVVQYTVGTATFDGFPWALLGNGDGTFQPRIAIAGAQHDALIADLDGDAYPDVLSYDSELGNLGSEFRVHAGNGDGTFAAPTVYSVPAMHGVQAVDLDADGILDLAFAHTDRLGVLLSKIGE